MKYVPLFIKRLGAPIIYYQWASRWIPRLGWISAVLMVSGLIGGLFLAPADYQQGESYRIIFIHVPSAWLSMFAYMVMATAAVMVIIWRIKVAEVIVSSCAPLGASFTFLALVTGSLWGKPMWGTYWVWDARLTSELLLLFIYLGIMALDSAIPDRRNASRVISVMAIVGVVNIPIIHYSVVWWNTLHQGASISRLDAPSIHPSMLVPLLLMAFAFTLLFKTLLLIHSRAELLEREQHAKWVNKVVVSS